MPVHGPAGKKAAETDPSKKSGASAEKFEQIRRLAATKPDFVRFEDIMD
jgi:hypothetical protein